MNRKEKIESITQHEDRNKLDWDDNVLVQPEEGEGSGKNGTERKHFKMSLRKLAPDTDWSEPTDDTPPSGKLVKDSLEQIELTPGPQGDDGLSAYEIAVKEGFVGDETAWLASLKGADGDDGKSAYEYAVEEGFEGDETAWLASLKGADGDDGDDGLSAYEVAVEEGFVGDETAWLASLKGADGDDGLSAYEVAVEEGFVGDETAWLASLKGADGDSAYEVAVKEGYTGTEQEFAEALADVENKLDKSKIVTTWNSPKDNEVPSAKLVKTALDGINVSGKEDKSNKITRLYDGVTDTQYASAKAVWDEFQIVKKATILESWDMFSEVTKDGRASDFVAPGDRLIGYWEVDGIYQPIPWEVLGIDQDEAVDESILHTVTLGTVDCLFSAMFDNPETNNPDSNRKNYGNNNWELSNIRQYLNSEDAPFVFSPTHDYDTAPTGYPTNGFLARLHPTMKEVIVPVKKWVSLANVDVEGDVSDKQLEETIFLLSQVEVGGGTGSVGTVTNEFVYQRYTSGSRIKYHVATAREWWLRSPSVGSSYNVGYVRTAGNVNYNYANNSNRRVAPACVIG